MMQDRPAFVWRIEMHESLPSTSDLCVQRARAGESDRLAIVARQQTAGRGTFGRDWLAPPGNLNLSALLRPRMKAAEAAQWGLLAAVALIDALAGFLPQAQTLLQLKWPNDILLRGRKISGILIDSAATAGGDIAWLVIGFGVNLVAAPAIAGRAVAALSEAIVPPSPEMLAEAILRQIDAWSLQWQNDGLAPVRAAWLRYAPPFDTPMQVARAGTRLHGVFAGLSDRGELLLRHDGRILALASGEIVADAR
jgi:BirA family biotin operon repressor/biotin-[acetyl-CoA-carboxylase] ligase